MGRSTLALAAIVLLACSHQPGEPPPTAPPPPVKPPTAVDSVPSTLVLGTPYKLITVNGQPLPQVYYLSPDGTFSAGADSGSLTFFANFMVRVATYRKVFSPVGPTQDQLGYDSVIYGNLGTAVFIARTATEFDSGRVAGTDLTVSWTLEGLSLGTWRYRRAP